MKKKPIEMIKNKYTPLIKMEDELSTLVQFQEKKMAEVIDRQDEEYANFLISQITLFMKENNVSICFILNKEELIDCLKEHNKLHYEILNLQSQLDQANERLKGAIVPKFKIGQEVYKVYTKDQRFPFKVKIIGVKITQTEEKISVLCDTEEDGIEMGWYPEKILFETLEEAEKKLQELRGGEWENVIFVFILSLMVNVTGNCKHIETLIVKWQ